MPLWPSACRSSGTRWALSWRVDMHFPLYAFVALCLSVIWDQVGAELAGAELAGAGPMPGGWLAGAGLPCKCAPLPTDGAGSPACCSACQVPYSGFGMGARFVDTIAWTHLIRLRLLPGMRAARTAPHTCPASPCLALPRPASPCPAAWPHPGLPGPTAPLCPAPPCPALPAAGPLHS